MQHVTLVMRKLYNCLILFNVSQDSKKFTCSLNHLGNSRHCIWVMPPPIGLCNVFLCLLFKTSDLNESNKCNLGQLYNKYHWEILRNSHDIPTSFYLDPMDRAVCEKIVNLWPYSPQFAFLSLRLCTVSASSRYNDEKVIHSLRM